MKSSHDPRHSGWCTFLAIYFTLAQPILLHRTHINETQYLQKDDLKTALTMLTGSSLKYTTEKTTHLLYLQTYLTLQIPFFSLFFSTFLSVFLLQTR